MDLNLLTALDALLEENSVQAAADRLNLSAPAMSRTLTRLRKATGDDILVRTGRTMIPTPRALEIRDEVRALVRRAHQVLAPDQPLDLQTLRRTFTVQGNDALLGLLAPALLGKITAPGVSLRFLPEAPDDRQDLARGDADLDVGADRPTSPQISHEVLVSDRLVAVFRAGHPLAKSFDLKGFAAADHLIVSRRGRLRDGIDDRLAEHGLSRRVLASLPTAAATLAVIASTDTVAVIAERASAQAREALGPHTHPLPLDLPEPEVVLSWHSRYDSDPAHAWLRDRCREAFTTT